MVKTLKTICSEYQEDYSTQTRIDVYLEALPKARAILADLKSGDKFSMCEFDDSPEEQALKTWLLDWIPSIGGKVFKEINQPEIYCFVME